MGKRKIPWLGIISILFFLIALSLPFIPDFGWKYWKTGYIAFLMAILAVPLLLMRHENKKSLWLRRIVLIVTLVFFGFLQWSCPRPVGSIEMLILGLKAGKPILVYGLKVGVVLGLTLFFGRYFCGWICPKGTLQELVHIPNLFTVPRKLDKILKYGKYVSLIALIAAPLFWDYRLFQHIGPFKVLFNLSGSTFLIIFLALTMLISVFVGRAYCRYFCPVGGLLSLFAALSPYKVRIDASVCNGCGQCIKSCPVDALIAERVRDIPKLNKFECIGCKQCEAACPKQSLTISARKF